MKRIVAGMTLVALAGMLVAAPPAFAGGRRYYHGGHGHHYHKGNGAGYLVGGLVLGALTGVVLGSIAAGPRTVYAEPPVVYQPAPAPVVVQPAPVYRTAAAGLHRLLRAQHVPGRRLGGSALGADLPVAGPPAARRMEAGSGHRPGPVVFYTPECRAARPCVL